MFLDKKEASSESVIDFVEVNGDKSFKHTVLEMDTLYAANIVILRNLSTDEISITPLLFSTKATGFNLKGLKESELSLKLESIKSQIDNLRINSGTQLVILENPEPYDFTEDRMERTVIALK
jgi:hypothetical protein